MHTRTISFSFSSALCFLIFGRIEFHFENCPIITAKLKTICSMVKEIGHYLLCSLIADLSAASTSCTAVKGTVHEIYRIHKLLIALVIFVILFSSLFFLLWFGPTIEDGRILQYNNIYARARAAALLMMMNIVYICGNDAIWKVNSSSSDHVRTMPFVCLLEIKKSVRL